jgi:large subunit ribosomal protein L25
MSDIILAAKPRPEAGSAASRRLVAEDMIPAVIYGQGTTPVSIAVSRRDLRIALSGPAGHNAVIQLTVDGRVQPTVVKELQRDPVRRTVRHVDFLVVDLDKNITAEVQLVIVGHAQKVKDLEGLVDAQVSTITISTTPRNIPSELQIDVSDMSIGDTKHARDVALPAGVTLAMDPDAVIVSAEATRATVAMTQASADTPAAS